MVLKFFKNNDLVYVAKNRKILRDKLKNANIKGFNEKVIRAGLKNSKSFTIKKGKITYKIEEISKEAKFKKLGKVKKEIDKKTMYKRKKKLGILHTIVYNKKIKILLNKAEKNDYVETIRGREKNIKKINERSRNALQNFLINAFKENKIIPQRKLIQVNINFITIDDNTDIKKDIWYPSTYLEYNKLLKELEIIYNKVVGQYKEIYFKGMEIKYYNTVGIRKQLVLGNSQTQKILRKFYSDKICNGHKDELLKFLNKYIINCVNTTKNCFVKSVLHCLYKTTESKKITNRLRNIERDCNFSKELRELDVMGILLSEYLKVKINIYNMDFKKEIVYGEENNKECDILIIHGHSFYLFKRDDKFNTTHFIQKFKDQNKMIITESINTTKKYYGAYDYETYNEKIKKNEKTSDTIPFALGYYHELMKKKKVVNIFRKNKKDDITLRFLCDLQKIPNKNKEDRKIILYAHNGGKFDIFNILQTCLKQNKRVHSILPKDGRIISFCLQISENTQVEFRDSICIIAGKLEKLLKDFKCNTKKLVDDVDYNYVNSKNYNSKEAFEMFNKYLENDVMGLYELITKIKDIIKKYYKIDLGKCLTNASVSRKFFIKNHNWTKYPLYEIPLEEYEKLKKHYLGGRNEAFILGVKDEKIYYYDFTSLYPWVMRNNQYPYGKYKLKQPKKQNNFNMKWFGVVKCLVKSNRTDFKPLHGIKEGGKLLFKHFKDWTELYLSTEEIKFSLKKKLGYDYKFIEVYDYETKRKSFFKKIIDDCYKLKIDAQNDNNAPLRAMAKIIINSIYGFWGIKLTSLEHIDIKTYPDETKKQFDLQKNLSMDKLVNFEDITKSHTMVVTRDNIDVDCANIIIAIMTTSYARNELYKLMNDVEKKGGKVYYCDTDSIVCNYCLEDDKVLNKRYNCKVKGDNIELGDLTNETDVRKGFYNKLVVLGCKTYFLNYSDDDFTGLEKIPKKHKSEFKFKGFNVKAYYDKKIYDHKNKEIILEVINKDGKYSVTPKDYELMNDDYTLITDNFNFVTSLKNTKINTGIKYMENQKKAKKQYHKGIIKDGKIEPFYN